MNIYVASSWRNPYQPAVVAALRVDGHEVYDFRESFTPWDQIDPCWREWSVDGYLMALGEPLLSDEFRLDMDALRRADVCVLVLPCGLDAGLEAGWACGAGKRLLVYVPDTTCVGLMVKMAELVSGDLDEIRVRLRQSKDA